MCDAISYNSEYFISVAKLIKEFVKAGEYYLGVAIRGGKPRIDFCILCRSEQVLVESHLFPNRVLSSADKNVHFIHTVCTDGRTQEQSHV